MHSEINVAASYVQRWALRSNCVLVSVKLIKVVDRKCWRNSFSLLLLSYEPWMFVKENPDIPTTGFPLSNWIFQYLKIYLHFFFFFFFCTLMDLRFYIMICLFTEVHKNGNRWREEVLPKKIVKIVILTMSQKLPKTRIRVTKFIFLVNLQTGNALFQKNTFHRILWVPVFRKYAINLSAIARLKNLEAKITYIKVKTLKTRNWLHYNHNFCKNWGSAYQTAVAATALSLEKKNQSKY